MSRLTLEKTMETSFRDIGDVSTDKAFHDYNRRISLLAESSRLNVEDIRELIAPDIDVSEVIDEAAVIGLSETLAKEDLYLPGYTAVVADEYGRLMGVQEQANDIPKLQEYGPSLMWSMKKLGHERLAVTRSKSSSSTMPGYNVVHEALSTEDLEVVPYGSRHHVGGTSLPLYFHPEAPGMRRFEHIIVHAGVSGAVATKTFHEYATKDERTHTIYDEAKKNFDTWLDGFDGNMFAGSIDSSLGALILAKVIGSKLSHDFSFTEHVMDSIALRHNDGINVH